MGSSSERHKAAGAQIVDDGQIVAPRHRDQLFEAGPLGETDGTEVRLMDTKQQSRLPADCGFVVGGARAVGRADLAQTRARTREHVGNAKAVADLDQLATRNDHLAAFGQRGEGRKEVPRRCC